MKDYLYGPVRGGILAAMLGVLLASPLYAGQSFVLSPDSPVLFGGASGSWDSELILPYIVEKDGTYYMFYMGAAGSLFANPLEIGFATSADGINWTKAACNPILSGDGTGHDADGVGSPVVLVEGDTWVMYYFAEIGSSTSIGRATATDPCGPWARSDKPVITAGGADEWDDTFVSPSSIVVTDGGYVIYYQGSPNWPAELGEVGRATSPDGITWTKYDDPTTSNAPYAESDPVLKKGPPGAWDSAAVWTPQMLKTETGWEAYYTGISAGPDSIGYATSADGIAWVRDPDNPIYNDPSTVVTESVNIVDIGTARFMYYDFGWNNIPGDRAVALAISDSDDDTVDDLTDNCLLVANADQVDADADGFGNRCDADFDQSGYVNYADLAFFAGRFGGDDPIADLDSDGMVGFGDLDIFRGLFNNAPGPSAN